MRSAANRDAHRVHRVHRARRARRAGDERGQAAGLEVLPFGVLVFVAGSLLVVRAWAAVDSHAAADAAARDYLRAYTAAPDVATARTRGEAAARASIEARRGAAARFRVTPPPQAFGACDPATVVVTIGLPGIDLPFAGDVGDSTVTATETDVVQPFGDAVARSGRPCDR